MFVLIYTENFARSLFQEICFVIFVHSIYATILYQIAVQKL